MRKSVALLATLIFISIIILLINSIFSIYEKYLKQSSFYTDMTQNSLLIKDTDDIMKKISKEINSSSDLDALFNKFDINYGNLNLHINIEPLSNKININEIALKTTSAYIKNFITNILNFYEIKDPQYFINILLDTIDTDENERGAYTEIKILHPSFPNGKIYSMKQFEKILEFYSKQRRDKNIFKIPWNNFIYFGDTKEYPIDCDRLSPKTARFLGLQFKNYSCKELSSVEENKQILNNLDIITFNRKIPYFIKINLSYNDQNITIKYNINAKKVISLEYDPIY